MFGKLFTFHFTVALIATSSEAFRHYQEAIPNGDRVTHPCETSQVWAGVGHLNPRGGGANNQFGKDLSSNGHTWTKSLCELDSDGDGKTNGHELGDPNCVWVKNAEPKWSNVSHPGVCDPPDSVLCKSRNESACDDTNNYVCDAVTNGQNVKTLNARLDYTAVPAVETTYICQTMELPSDQSYDVIGIQPLLNNTDVIHHIVFWGCQLGEPRVTYRTPQVCGMAPDGCNTILDVWTQGHIGKCYTTENGLRIGKDAWTYGVMQLHWNNPQQSSHYYDNSGLALHYTPSLRKNVEVTIFGGPQFFEIPPNKASHVVTGTITERCSLYIHQVYLHMHLTGKIASLKQMRGGVEVRTIAVDDPYEYNSPVFHRIYPPIEYQAGDHLHLTCQFNTSTRTSYTYWGDATSDEMCYAFISVTPAGVTSSTNYRDPCGSATHHAGSVTNLILTTTLLALYIFPVV